MAKVKLITIEKLMEMMENDEDFILVEVLAESAYQEGHLPDAVNIPVPHDMTSEEIAEAADELGIEKNETVVVYCASYACGASTRAARLLSEAGFTDVLDYKAGKAAWREASLEVEQPVEAETA